MASKYMPKKYLVIYLDFLGQKDFFDEVTDINVDEAVSNKISYVSDSVKRGFAGFKLLSEMVVKEWDKLYTQLVERNVAPYSSAPREWFEYEMLRCKPKVHTFSDGTMVYLPLSEDVAPIVMPSLMFQLCRLFLQNLYEGSLYRGCITFGDGWEIADGVLYGPVVDRVAHIEKRVAIYPRVVVSDEIVDYFELNKIECFSPRIDKMIEADSDGSFILNYLSLEFLTSPLHGQGKEDVWTYVRYMHWFVRNELAKYRDAGNIEMYRRYRMWDAYSYYHENELINEGILQKDELSAGSQHKRLGRYPLGKYLLFYLQFQPEPLQKLGYDGLMQNAEIISRVATEIDGVHQRLKDCAREMFEEQFGDEMSPAEIEREVLKIRKTSCGTIQMSNYLMLYVRNIGHCGGHYFSAWLLQMKEILRNCAIDGVFVRGSIEYDVGWELNDGILYGPVIQKAAKLEENKAGYPRIVVSDNLLRELGIGKDASEMRNEAQSGYFGNQYIRPDEDNVWIFDYLEIGDDDKERNRESQIIKGIELSVAKTHEICEVVLRQSRRGFVVNPQKSWPILSLDMYFRRKLSEAKRKA